MDSLHPAREVLSMSIESDFSPIVEQGQEPAGTGILGRRKRRLPIPATERGFVRVRLDAAGTVTAEGDVATAGERYWSKPGSWVKVDVGEHDLEFECSLTMSDGHSGYVVTVVASVSVVDAAEAVRRHIKGVRRHAGPLISQLCTGAVSGFVDEFDADDALASLRIRQAKVSTAVTKELPAGREIDGGWLKMVVQETRVEMDSATAEHYTKILEEVRRGDLEITKLKNSIRTATARGDHEVTQLEQQQRVDSVRMAIQGKWAKHFATSMKDPVLRAVQRVAADPTSANLASVSKELDASEQWTRVEVVEILKQLIANNYVDNVDDLNKIRLVVQGLQNVPGGIAQKDETLTLPEGQSPVVVIDVPNSDITTEEPEVDADKDWSV
jgi:hypothetical protein